MLNHFAFGFFDLQTTRVRTAQEAKVIMLLKVFELFVHSQNSNTSETVFWKTLLPLHLEMIGKLNADYAAEWLIILHSATNDRVDSAALAPFPQFVHLSVFREEPEVECSLN